MKHVIAIVLAFPALAFAWCGTAEPRVANIYKEMVFREALAQDVDPWLVMAVINVESSCNPKAVSRVGARGLMQVMPFHHDLIGKRNVFAPRVNIQVGTALLRRYLDNNNGNMKKALAQYSGGARNYHSKVMAAKTNVYFFFRPQKPSFWASSNTVNR